MTYFSQQIQHSLIVALVTLFTALLFALVSKFLGQRKIACDGFWVIVFVGSIAVIVTFTLLRLGVREREVRQIVLIPFAGGEYSNISKSLMAIKVFGNVALFVPFGISLQLLIRRQIWVTVVAGLTTSLCVEVLQYILARGTSTAGDLILNCAGAFVGATIARLLVGLRPNWASKTLV
jgi:glycopeptide antibiotics resistance protein